MRIQIRYFLICCIVLALCGAVLSYGMLPQQKTEKEASEGTSANDQIVSMYEELIALRQQAVEEQRRLIQLGQASTSEMVDAETRAAEARIQLAQFQGKKETVIRELQNLVQVLAQLRNSLKLEVELGVRPRTWIYEIDSRLLETKIRLAKMEQQEN